MMSFFNHSVDFLLSGLSIRLPDLLSLGESTLVTLQIAILSLICGLILAIILTKLELSRSRFISLVATSWVTVIRGLPELLVVVGVFYAIPSVLNLFYDGFLLNLGLVKWWVQYEMDWDVSPFTCGVIALALLFSAYASQTLRGALQAIPKGQTEAAKALCLSKQVTFFVIIMPQMWRYALPGLTNQWLVLLKDTALVSMITVNDMIFQAKNLAAKTNAHFTWYLITALIYLIITLLSQFIINQLNHRAKRHERNT